MYVVFTPHMSLEEMFDQAIHDITSYQRALHGDSDSMWKTWGGDNLATMMNSPNATLLHLSGADVSPRLAAASLVADYWPSNELFAPCCLQAAFSDREATIRGAALTAILYKLHPFIQDPSGMLASLLGRLRAALNRNVSSDWAIDAMKQAEEIVKWSDEHVRAVCEQLAGEHLSAMMGSSLVAKSYLEDSQPNLRRAALLVLHNCWKNQADLRAICKRLIQEDDDINVRIQAQDVLAAEFVWTNDKDVLKQFAKTVRNSNLPIELRKHAYISLFAVCPVPPARLLNAASPDFRFPDDIDWPFVESVFDYNGPSNRQ